MITEGRYAVRLEEGWSFQPDPLNQGEREGWPANGLPSPAAVSVPHTWNVQEGLEEYRGAGWYEQILNIPEEWTGCRIRIRFEAVYRDKDIWVNGVQAGSHYNSGYTPFEVDLTPHILIAAGNRIVIKVDNANSDAALPKGGSFDWADDGGLIRPLTLIVTGRTAVEQVRVEPKVIFADNGNSAGGKLSAHIKLCEPGETVSADIAVYRNEARIWQGTQEVQAGVPAWGVADIELPEVDLWHFDQPHLYQLEVVLRKGDKVQDRVLRTFGFREIVVKGHELWLNREPVRLMGVEWMPGSHPDVGMAERIEDLTAMLERLKEANCVITRFHWQQGNDLLDWCDRNGLLVQEEIPHWQQPAEPDNDTFMLAMAQAREMIMDHSHHPCIFAWGMGNELDGQSEVTLRYMERLKQEIVQLDSTRLVNYVSNTLQLQPAKDATGAGDMLMWNDYIGTWHGDLDENEVIRQIIADHPARPMVVAEYGLCEPAYEGGDARRINILLDKTEIYRRYPQFAALIFFSLNDYRTQMGEDGEGRMRQRIHGSLDIYNRTKPSFAALRELSSPLMLAGEPVWKDGGLEVTLKCRADIPCYAVKGYTLTVSPADGRASKLVIPDLYPGDIKTMHIPLPSGAAHNQTLSIQRPAGFSVLERQLD
ncbi:glycoside hydrolase family 2 protein [Paenibacillus sp. HW567]|uniref:glycoside hydrolase family 2 protein n=1 Tax=Paenibacillus sp. HW567 TaxID=1034769 RepID=UPI000360FAB6|nr:glycoside hydrolase family 2 [Paenibacillus sp. HW567]